MINLSKENTRKKKKRKKKEKKTISNLSICPFLKKKVQSKVCCLGTQYINDKFVKIEYNKNFFFVNLSISQKKSPV